ncbi:MAG TPA: hypothetical protein VMX13_08020 [Sedimentisphaerales bacterium]|nr:hypothetical protein [Sedimentisphaerales bacterium]
MRNGKEQKTSDTTGRSLECRLRRLADVEPPETLKARLVQAIPERADESHRVLPHLRWYPQAWDFGVTAAAAVVIIGLMLMVNYGLSVPSQAQLLEDTALAYPRWDQNFFSPDQNNTGGEKFWPREHSWPMTNQSEMGY